MTSPVTPGPRSSRPGGQRRTKTRRPLPETVHHELARRLLRAPQWAAPSAGWPFGRTALAYFDRLAVTPSTSEQAEAALDTLLLELADQAG
jgi:hypothetical protein